MPSETGAFGAHGEAVASTVLAKRGYRIVERNVRSRWGELDMVAYDGTTLVFVEVKARRGARFGEPAYAVDRRKQRRLVRLAQQYLVRRKLGEPLCRFDIVIVDERPDGPWVEVIPNAFDASCLE
ncbi:MAG: YraN family protein [Nitrospirae bacterium]|nr:YraN family protein [Nitrospirota bacterium]